MPVGLESNQGIGYGFKTISASLDSGEIDTPDRHRQQVFDILETKRRSDKIAERLNYPAGSIYPRTVWKLVTIIIETFFIIGYL